MLLAFHGRTNAHRQMRAPQLAAMGRELLLHTDEVLRNVGLELPLHARIVTHVNCVHFSLRFHNEMFFFHVGDAFPAFPPVQQFSPNILEDTSTLSFVESVVGEWSGPREVGRQVMRTGIGSSRHGLTIPVFLGVPTTLRAVEAGLTKWNTMIVWPAVMNCGSDFPAANLHVAVSEFLAPLPGTLSEERRWVKEDWKRFGE